jgi:hypothetical protein
MTEVKTELSELRAKLIEHLGNLIPGLRNEAEFLADALLGRTGIPDIIRRNAELTKELAAIKRVVAEAAELLGGTYK